MHAILAPSGHNTQPWLFRIRDNAVELLADRTRGLAVVDPDDRALVISCGAALATLRSAARNFGHQVAVEVLPDPSDEDLLARVSLEQGEPANLDEEELFRAIPERHTNRQAFEQRELPDELTERLVSDADEEGVSLQLVRGDDRAAVAELIAEATGSRWPTSASGASWPPGSIRTEAVGVTGCAATVTASATFSRMPDRS